jgi:hypothetical protein
MNAEDENQNKLPGCIQATSLKVKNRNGFQSNTIVPTYILLVVLTVIHPNY